MTERYGLGRVYRPDPRDWSVEYLHGFLRAAVADPDLTQPLGAAIASSPYFATWAGVRALWSWIKHHPPGPTPAPSPAVGPWPDSVVLDQGSFGTCVGNGWAGWGDTGPVQDTYDEKVARAIYFEATVLDGSPDDPDKPGGGQQGTSIRAGAKAMQKRGRLTAYAFAKGLSDIDEWLANHGPVVMGTNWYEGMFSPNSAGLVALTGAVAGGHCWIVRGRVNGTYLCRNSWGGSWGKGGDFYVTPTDLARLLSEQGEACLAAEIGPAVGKIALTVDGQRLADVLIPAAWRPA